MQYYRCKCGKLESFTTMGVPLCEVCPECGSTLAQGPEGHLPPQPHEWVTRYDENTGIPYEKCKNCHIERTKEEAALWQD